MRVCSLARMLKPGNVPHTACKQLLCVSSTSRPIYAPKAATKAQKTAKTYMLKQQKSARYVEHRRALALSGGATAIPLMAAVVSERAVWIGYKCRAADALVAQVACSLKRYDNAPAAECN